MWNRFILFIYPNSSFLIQVCEELLQNLKELLASLSAISSAQAPQSDSMMSSIIDKTKHLRELSSIYERCRGQVSHRAQDLEIVRSKLAESRGVLVTLTATLDRAELSLDLDTKMAQLDALKVR